MCPRLVFARLAMASAVQRQDGTVFAYTLGQLLRSGFDIGFSHFLFFFFRNCRYISIRQSLLRNLPGARLYTDFAIGFETDHISRHFDIPPSFLDFALGKFALSFVFTGIFIRPRTGALH